MTVCTCDWCKNWREKEMNKVGYKRVEDQLLGFALLFFVAGLVVIPLSGIAVLTAASFGYFD